MRRLIRLAGTGPAVTGGLEAVHVTSPPASVLQGAGCRVQGAGFRVQGSGCRVQGAGFRVQGSGCRVQGSGFRVQSSKVRVEGAECRV